MPFLSFPRWQESIILGVARLAAPASVKLIWLPKIRKKDPRGVLFSYRGSQIRTDDILLPKQTLYQAELHPEVHANIAKIAENLNEKTKKFNL